MTTAARHCAIFDGRAGNPLHTEDTTATALSIPVGLTVCGEYAVTVLPKT